MVDAASGRTDPGASWEGHKDKRVNPRYRKGAKSEPTGKGEGSRSNAQYRGAGVSDGSCPEAWGTEAQGTHDNTFGGAGRQCRGMASVPGKGRRDIEPVTCLYETGMDCDNTQTQATADGMGSNSHAPEVS